MAKKVASQPTKKTAIQCEGSIAWNEIGGLTQTTSAIFRDNAVAFEFTLEDVRYSGTLKFDGERYVGDIRCRSANDTWSASASCRLFKHNDEILFVGSWKEDGLTHRFWLELEPSDI